MEITNKIKDGLHLDNNYYDQPEMTMRDNLNGVITDIGNGNYKWSDMKGNTLSFTLPNSYEYMAHCKIKDRIIIIALSPDTLNVRFIEIRFAGDDFLLSLSLSPAIVKNLEGDHISSIASVTELEITDITGTDITLNYLPEDQIALDIDWFIMSLDDYNVAEPGLTGDYTTKDKVTAFDFANKKVSVVDTTGFSVGEKIGFYTPWSNYTFIGDQATRGILKASDLGAWGAKYCAAGPTWFNEDNEKYYMAFYGRSVANIVQIGLMSSPDLIVWTLENGGNPIISSGDDADFATYIFGGGNAIDIGDGRIAFAAHTRDAASNDKVYVFSMDKDGTNITWPASASIPAGYGHGPGLAFDGTYYHIICAEIVNPADLATWKTAHFRSSSLDTGYSKIGYLKELEYAGNENFYAETYTAGHCAFLEKGVLYCLTQGNSNWNKSMTRGNGAVGLWKYSGGSWSPANNFTPEIINPMYFQDIPGEDYNWAGGHIGGYASFVKRADKCYMFFSALYTADTYQVAAVELIGTSKVLATISNASLNLSHLYPIRTCWGFYENENIQRVYWSDYNNPPRVINLEDIASVKFLDFFPVIDKVYGHITASTTLASGSVKAGTVFFAWRYYTNDGYYTDWSQLSNPIAVTDTSPGSSLDDYQDMEGAAPDVNTGKKITIEISNIDSDYDNIQVCAFYSNDYNIALPGSIFFDGAITNTVMSFSYTGSSNAGTVTIDDLIETSIKIDKFKDSVVAKKQNVIANIIEREELNLSESIDVDIAVTTKYLPIDVAGYPGKMTSGASIKALNGLLGTAADEAAHTFRRGQWYYAVTEVSWNDGSGAVVTPIDNVFYVPEDAGVSLAYTSGTFKAIVIKKKYLLAGGTPGGNINTEYAFEYEDLDDEYYDWKSQKVCRWYKAYPMGEKIRLGVLFFDLTGRPWFVRHLKNNNLSGFGTGDTDVPVRSYDNPMLALSGWTAVGTDGYMQNACASLKALQVNGLDITDIKDQISGFMIVRTPIERQYLGMGLILPTYLLGNDVYSHPNFFPYDVGADPYAANYFGCYSFYCPEDLMNFKGFAIQSGDEIENIMYLMPYVFNESYTLAGGFFQGLGRQESIDYDFYQKLLIRYDPIIKCANGVPGISHKIISVTKYELGDADLPVNPADSTKLYQYFCAGYNDTADTHAGINGNHSVLILDIVDDTSNVKGPSELDCNQANPYALLCAVKRPNADPYGGYAASSLANSVYISTGHYQEITTAVLAQIESAATWIFNEIDIFGGDTFVQLFDYKRLYIESDLGTNHLGHGIIFPVESRINLSMREGEHLSKTRSYDSSFNTSGLRKAAGSTVLEDFNYNDGYSSDDINDRYLPLPFNYNNSNEFLTRIRYSSEKSYGENRDSFRRFAANDYIDVDPMKGAITNIRAETDKLVYWQPDEVGYIPIKERALTQNSVGQSVQLGVGGIFERYDRLIEEIGNSHQFGLIESPIGYHWYDSRRKIYLSIGHDLKISFESLLKGMDSWFQTYIPDGLEAYDNPLSSFGITGGYDPASKMIFSSFIVPGPLRYTIGINAVLNKFIGRYDIYPCAYITYKNHMFLIKQEKITGYVHGTNNTYMNFFGTQYTGLVSIIIREESNEAKIFDTFEIIATPNFFTSILYDGSMQSIEEIIATYPAGVFTLASKDYKHFNRRWYGSFPKMIRERLNDGYLKVTFKIASPYLVELYEMKSLVRKNI